MNEYRLGELIDIDHGYAFKSDYYSDEGEYILLTPGNFKEDGGLKLKGDKEKYFIGDFSDEYLLAKGDLLVVMTDLRQDAPILGSSMLIPSNDRYLHNQRLGKVVNIDESKIDKEYLYHLFNFYEVREQIKASASGSTVRHSSPDRIYDVEVSIPDIDKQRNIASTLSSFDDLIENNSRRIEILEEMARRIYREWFVHFRFPYAQCRRRSKALATERSGEQATPGDGKPKMVDSGTELGEIPEGWEVKPLSDVAKVNPGNISTDYEGEIEYINISGVDEGSINETEIYDFEDAPSRAKRKVEHGDIIWSSVRPNLKSYAMVLNPKPNLIASTGFGVIRPKKLPASFIYNFSTTEYFVQYLVNHTRGSAYPAVNVSDFKNAPIVVPDENLVEKFDEIICK